MRDLVLRRRIARSSPVSSLRCLVTAAELVIVGVELGFVVGILWARS